MVVVVVIVDFNPENGVLIGFYPAWAVYTRTIEHCCTFEKCLDFSLLILVVNINKILKKINMLAVVVKEF